MDGWVHIDERLGMDKDKHGKGHIRREIYQKKRSHGKKYLKKEGMHVLNHLIDAAHSHHGLSSERDKRQLYEPAQSTAY